MGVSKILIHEKRDASSIRFYTHNLFGIRADWEARRRVLIDGIAELKPDLTTLQETILTDSYDQAADILGNDYQVAQSAIRETNGSGILIGSRWPIIGVLVAIVILLVGRYFYLRAMAPPQCSTSSPDSYGLGPSVSSWLASPQLRSPRSLSAGRSRPTLHPPMARHDSILISIAKLTGGGNGVSSSNRVRARSPSARV